MITALGLKISESAKKAKGVTLAREILNTWLPLDRLLLDRIVSELPNPIEAQRFRLPYLLQINLKEQKISKEVRESLANCAIGEDAPLIVFVSKMITFSRKQINERGL